MNLPAFERALSEGNFPPGYTWALDFFYGDDDWAETLAEAWPIRDPDGSGRHVTALIELLETIQGRGTTMPEMLAARHSLSVTLGIVILTAVQDRLEATPSLTERFSSAADGEDSRWGPPLPALVVEMAEQVKFELSRTATPLLLTEPDPSLPPSAIVTELVRLAANAVNSVFSAYR